MDLTKIKQLREKTGASIADCKTCIDESEGNMNKAEELLQKRGTEIASKKSSRSTSEGWIGAYVHSNGKISALVSLKCETDFVARNDEFQKLACDIAMHIAAMSPEYIRPEDIPNDVLERAVETEKFTQETCLLNQFFIRDDKKTIGDVLQDAIQKLGENIEVTDFTRMQL